jgi:hypothetical protein
MKAILVILISLFILSISLVFFIAINNRWMVNDFIRYLKGKIIVK